MALGAVLGPLPHADALAKGLSLGIVADLSEMRPGLLQGSASLALGATALGILAGSPATGGALEVLTTADEPARWLVRFGRGPSSFFGRFLRAGILAVAVGGLLAGLLFVPFAATSKKVSESAWELARLVHGAGAAASSACSSRCSRSTRRPRDPRPRRRPAAARAYFRGLAAVLRHPLARLGTWAVNGLFVLAALAAYVAAREAMPAAAPLVAVVALQQAFVLTRCLFRTAMLARSLADRHVARPVPAAEPPSPAAPQRPEALPVPVPADEAAALFASVDGAAGEPPAGELAGRLGGGPGRAAARRREPAEIALRPPRGTRRAAPRPRSRRPRRRARPAGARAEARGAGAPGGAATGPWTKPIERGAARPAIARSRARMSPSSARGSSATPRRALHRGAARVERDDLGAARAPGPRPRATGLHERARSGLEPKRRGGEVGVAGAGPWEPTPYDILAPVGRR
ncbi:MAG: hypothetical protein U0599_21650 [Vicinamibacteria bacterium]